MWSKPDGRKPRGGGERYPLTTGRGLGGSTPPQNFFSILDLKMDSFGALWVPVGGMHPLIPPWIRHCPKGPIEQG